jgi:TPR repeat protein
LNRQDARDARGERRVGFISSKFFLGPGVFGVLAVSLFGAAAGCNRKSKGDESDAAPVPSVVGIAVGLDYCVDVAFCQKKCDEGNAGECRRLGVAYQLGKSAPKDEAHAALLFEKACTMKSPQACVSAGQMFEYEHGVAKDFTKAAAFYKTACDLDFVPGCYNFAIMLENGRGVPKDEWNAAYYYDVACKAGLQQACAKSTELRARAPIAIDAGLRD